MIQAIFEALVFIWGISAAFAVEIQSEQLRGRSWQYIAIISLMPVYNTMVVIHYLRQHFSQRKG